MSLCFTADIKLSVGVGAIFFAEHTRELFPELGEGDEEETNLIAALTPSKYNFQPHQSCNFADGVLAVYWMVFFSIVVHGISVPLIHLLYKYLRVPTIQEDTSETLPFSRRASLSDKDLVERQKSVEVFSDEKKIKNFSWARPSEVKGSIDHGTQSSDLSDLKEEARKGHESVIGPFRWSVEKEYSRVTSDRCNRLT